MTGAGGANEVAVNAPETGIHQRLDAVQMLYTACLFQLVPFAVLIVIGIGDGFAVGNLFSLGVLDGTGGQVCIDGCGFSLGQVEINTAQAFDDLRDTVEVDGDIMPDVQLKIVIDRPDTGFRRIGPGYKFTVFIVCVTVAVGDDGLILPAGHFHVGVAGNGRKLDGTVIQVDGKNDQHVGTLGILTLFREQLFLFRSADVQADQQDVDDIIRQVFIDFQFVRINGLVQFILGGKLFYILIADGGKTVGFTGLIIPQEQVAFFIKRIILIEVNIFRNLFLSLLRIYKKGKKQGECEDQGEKSFHTNLR